MHLRSNAHIASSQRESSERGLSVWIGVIRLGCWRGKQIQGTS